MVCSCFKDGAIASLSCFRSPFDDLIADGLQAVPLFRGGILYAGRYFIELSPDDQAPGFQIAQRRSQHAVCDMGNAPFAFSES